MESMDPKLEQMVERLAVKIEGRYQNGRDATARKALHAAVLDEFEEDYEDVLPVALRGGWSYFVWEVLRKRDGKSRKKGVSEMMFGDEEEEAQPKLPSEDWARTAVYNVPVGGNQYERRRLILLTTEEVRAARREYEKRGREMFQQARPLRAYEQEMDRREFGPADTVRKLYKSA